MRPGWAEINWSTPTHWPGRDNVSGLSDESEHCLEVRDLHGVLCWAPKGKTCKEEVDPSTSKNAWEGDRSWQGETLLRKGGGRDDDASLKTLVLQVTMAWDAVLVPAAPDQCAVLRIAWRV